MKIHKVHQVIAKQGGNYRVIFKDGTSVFWPREYMQGLTIGTLVCEHQHKDGQTVAYSWRDKLRFVVQQPANLDDSIDFVEKFKWIDRASFNNAVVRATGYRMDHMLLPDTIVTAHNMALLRLRSKSR